MPDTSMRKSRRSGEDGYTLTELLVVIVVLALVAAAVTPNVLGRFNSAKTRTAALHAESLAASLDDFFIDNGRYPTAAEGLQALLTAPTSLSSWSGPYVRSERNLIDPWSNAFAYVAPASGTGPRVVSYGADGVEGGDGTAADIAYP